MPGLFITCHFEVIYHFELFTPRHCFDIMFAGVMRLKACTCTMVGKIALCIFLAKFYPWDQTVVQSTGWR